MTKKERRVVLKACEAIERRTAIFSCTAISHALGVYANDDNYLPESTLRKRYQVFHNNGNTGNYAWWPSPSNDVQREEYSHERVMALLMFAEGEKYI